MARSTAVAAFVAVVAVLALLASPVVAQRHAWQLVEGAAVDPSTPIDVMLAIKHQDHAYDALKGACQAVSDPELSTYTQYLEIDELTALLGAADNEAMVYNWLMTEAGASNVRRVETRDFVVATIRADRAAAAFGNLRFDRFSHRTHTQAHILRSASPYRLPSHIEAVVDVVVGVSDFPPLAPKPNRKHRHMIRDSVTTTAAAAVVNGASDKAPVKPVIGLMYASDTTVTLMTLQLCWFPNATAPSLSNTTTPCDNTLSPITHYEADLWVDGKQVNAALMVPLSDVSAEVQPGLTGNTTVYNVKLPYTVKPFQAVNASLRAVNAMGMSDFGRLPYKNLSLSLQRQLATPYVTPDFLTSYYGLGPASPIVPSATTQAVAEFEGQFYSPQDLKTFREKYGVADTKVTLHGSNIPQLPGGESTLDIEWIIATSPGVTTDFWYASKPNTAPNASFIMGWAMEMTNSTSPPLITSISYGLGESQYGPIFGASYIPRCNMEFLKLCTRGVGVLVASGDAGASNNGHGSESCAIQPDFPSSSPWITSVSASFVSNKAPARFGQTLGELPISIPNGMFWTTGGGFSSEPTCEQPWYQKEAVAKYLATPNANFPPSSMFNSSLRAYPDVSAIGHNLMCVWEGSFVPVDGTSAASPIFAGILSRLNVARMTLGKKQLGFANPLLYKLVQQAPSTFYDMTQGSNACAGFTCCEYGFSAEPGYDAMSGLGSIGNFALVEAMVVALP